MIVFAPFIKLLWCEMFNDLYTVGKIVMFPLFAVFTVCLGVAALGETIVIDPVVILLVLCTKDMSVRDLFDFWW